MSEPKLISPMLDTFDMGGPISDHDGVRCCPAMKKDSNDRYIVKVISIPASQTQLDALLLTGAYTSLESAKAYFKTLADGIVEEAEALKNLSKLEGFVPFQDLQLTEMDDGTGYDIYLLSPYRRTLSRQFVKEPFTHLAAINLGLDLCASLALARRSGYLYVDLKPNNIYVTGDKEYRIGDLGFIKLDSLKYASLPNTYRSQYTAPEITDAFCALNQTIDIYAAGLILYQAYNGGTLPFQTAQAPAEAFGPPMYADYEMSEIILKACAPNPADRWQDPMQMGQALVSYMQRNGANDTPIVPPVSQEETPAEAVAETTEEAGEVSAAPAAEEETALTAEALDEEEAAALYEEDELGNLSFLLADTDETAPSAEDVTAEYDALSDEVSDILAQADELAALEVPEPVVAPDPIDIPMPEPITAPAEEATENEEDASDGEENVDTPAEEAEEEEETPRKRKSHWLRNSILILLLLALIGGGVYYYINYYLQPIDGMTLSGTNDTLTVQVDTEIDEKLLLVVCSDPHGNQIKLPVVDGKVTFTDLVPDTAYTIKLEVEGFHKLTGYTSKAYSTPIQTSIVQFNAVCGADNGTAILSFTVDGPDSQQWTVEYSAADEETKTAAFSSHMVTISGLTEGKPYTFRIIPDTELYLTGEDTITFTPGAPVYAEELTVVSCIDNKLTVTWSAPEGSSVESWTVRCYNDTYNQTVITSQTTATFEELDHTQSFTVEVTAAGMSVNQRVFVAENAITLSDIRFDTSDPGKLSMLWNSAAEVPAGGWHIAYTIGTSDLQESVISTSHSAVIPYLLPGGEYQITVSDAAGNIALGTPIRYTVPAAEPFSCNYDDYPLTADDITFQMCKTPEWTNWDRYDLGADDYTTQFAAGQRASFLVHLEKDYGYSDVPFVILYVIEDSSGKPVIFRSVTTTWDDMWTRGYCELNVPQMPETSGEYTMDIFFDGAPVHTQPFAIAQ